MPIEIERKAWARDPEKLEQEVRRIARGGKSGRKADFYYAPAGDRDPIRNCFRIRLAGDKAWVTFKDKKILRRSEINRETEIPIRNPFLWARLFESVGFRMFIRKEKHSRIYRHRQDPEITIELNRVSDLGNFIEVEILRREKREAPEALRKIGKVFRELGIGSREVEPRLYIEILRKRLRGKKYRFNPRARDLERAYSLPAPD
ncbi:MAG: class IV adenylate cyclase [Proteobacteria bacterium]|nr:class IV adenylate cyclase [Pseudomonadota bacterium]